MSALAAYGAASAGVNLLSGFMGKSASDKLARQQKKLGNLQADLLGDENDETLRRLDRENDSILSTGEAMVGASGFSSGSSQEVYMSSMASEMKRQRDWTEESGDEKERLTRMGAKYSADSLYSQGKSQMFAGIGNSFKGMATAAENS